MIPRSSGSERRRHEVTQAGNPARSKVANLAHALSPLVIPGVPWTLILALSCAPYPAGIPSGLAEHPTPNDGPAASRLSLNPSWSTSSSSD